MMISSSKQKRKFGATKKVGAEGYKLMDVKLLEKLLSNSCICKICKKKMGKMEIWEDCCKKRLM